GAPAAASSRSGTRGRRSSTNSKTNARRCFAMRVSVFGLGYVGCVTAACLAKAGHAVVGVDVNAEKVAMLNAATSPIVEPGLPELLREVVGLGRLRAATRVAVNPEFMREGSSLNDFARPPLTLVGCGDPATASLLRLLYESVQAPFVHTSIRTAEMVKYAANAFHALKVCFANEVADVCAALGADSAEVMRLFAMDRKLNVSEA